MPDFDILEEIANVESIAVGKRIREPQRLEKRYGSGRCRKMKGEAKIRPRNGRVVRAELPIGTKLMESAEKSLRENVISIE